jgi:formimidoylglutamate deiminase
MDDTLYFDQALLEHGWADCVRLRLSGGRIAAVETGCTPLPGDHRGGIAVPGSPNLHSHGFQRGMAGLAERRGPSPDSFWTWREVMYGFLDRMDPDDVEAITAQAYVEMLEAGFTQVGEFHYVHHDPAGAHYAAPAEMATRIAAAAASAGIGLTLLPVFYAHGGFGGVAPTHGQRRFVCSLDAFVGLLDGCVAAVSGLPGAVVGVAPHSLRAITPDELHELAQLRPGAPLHMHIAEQEREVADCLAWSGARPVEWLLRHMAVDDRWCLVHATHMVAAETAGLAATGAVAGLCPLTEASLGDGIFDGQGWQAAGGRYGVGSDSNIRLDFARELCQLETSQRLALRQRNVMAGEAAGSVGRRLFGTALAGGSQALGVDPARLAAGAAADIVGLDADHPSLTERRGDDALDSWIFAADRAAVQDVWCGGRHLVVGGRHVERDVVLQRYRRVMRKLLAD